MKINLLFVSFCILSSGVMLLSGCGNDSKTPAQQSENPVANGPGKNQPQPKADHVQTIKKENVIMNGIAWDEKMEAEFKDIYKIQPIPGNYWYDATSGLWGMVGGQALGFIYAGHSYGTLKSDASNGNTNIFINGRHIPMNEALVWGQLMGTPAQVGRYWLDGKGNVGYEGNPYVVAFNLYALANQNSYRGKGGGDNFWSSRFASGNTSDDGSFGYVSIPGTGTVSYER